MQPPVKERLGLVPAPYSTAEGRSDTGLMARSMMYLFAAGAAVTSVSLVLTPAGGAPPRIAATGACALALAVFVLLAYDRIPVWGFDALLGSGTVLVAWGVYASGDPTSPYAMFYFWIAIYAFYFLSRARASLQMAFIAAAYLGVLISHGQLRTTPVLHWALVTTILVVAGGFIGVQREHLERLIDRLTDAARTDSLTGLLNRRGFEELFATELERARRSDRPLSVIICDLDAFKSVNDRFGHAAGDLALEKLSAILRRTKRRVDTAARIGGEEFAVIAPDSDQHAAYILAERMRREVRERFADEPYALTLSVGLASYPRHGESSDALIEAADEALYAAKKLGRNRTVVFSAEINETLLASVPGPASRFGRGDSPSPLPLADD
ncbi:MAG: GGDEF domain-containing protein [Actinobacteria bacterium]|nr:GGDEF domain-containing protein [Actinomycetota bacterium]